MTDETNDIEPSEDELTALKNRADMMGIKYHPSIGLDKLREKVNGAINGEPEVFDEPIPTEPVTTSEPVPIKETEAQRKVRMKNEANELGRVNISCMNPNKSEWDGEIFTAGNTVIGSFKKFVPFNVDWHVPRAIMYMIEQRKCQVFYTHTDHRGNKSRRGRLTKEFSVNYLDPLTPGELHDLAQRQAMANGTQAA